MSLSKCLKAHGKDLTAAERQRIKDAVAAYRAEDMSHKDAASEAIMDYLEEIYQEANDVRGQIGLKPLAFDKKALEVGLENFITPTEGGNKIPVTEGPKFHRKRHGATNNQGFYSQMQRVLDAKLPGRGDAAQVKTLVQALARKGEFKAEELEWSGLGEWLDGRQGKVSKADVLDFLAANRMEVREVVKGGGAKSRVEPVEGTKRWRVVAPDGTTEEFYSEADARRAAISADLKGGDTKFDQYQLPGGENYREMLLTLPPVKEPLDFHDWLVRQGEPLPTDALRQQYEREKAHGKLPLVENNVEKGYRSSHWDEPNVLAHVRFSERTDADGKRVLHIEEIQSDWGQSNRKVFNEVTKPERLGELTQNVLGGKFGSLTPLDVVNGGVLSTLKHDQVLDAVISNLPVDVVDHLSGVKVSPKEFFSNPDVGFDLLPTNHRLTVAQGVASATRDVGARLRTKLLEAGPTGGDVHLLPALNASDLSPREIVGLLAPKRIYHVGLPSRTGGGEVAGSGAKITGGPSNVTRGSDELNAAMTTDRSGSRAVTGVGAELSARPAGFDAEVSTTTLARFLDWHGKINTKTGVSSQAKYLAAPFVIDTGGFSMLAMKRMIRFAAENGFDRVAWTPGEQQAERYDLSKQVSRVVYTKVGNLVAYDLNGGKAFMKEAAPEELADYIGKDAAQKLLDQVPDQYGHRELSGLDLKVGGEGMKGFYDRILPAEVNKYIKKWGAKVGETRFTAESGFGRTQDENLDVLMGADVKDHAIHSDYTLHAFDITDAMRESVMQGQPLFQRITPQTPAIKPGPASASARSSQALNIPREGWQDYLIQKIADSFRRLQVVTRSIQQRGGMSQGGHDAYQAYELYSGRTGERLRDFEERHLEPLLKTISDNKLTVEEVDDFLMASHAPKRNAVIAARNPEFAKQGLAGSGMTDAEAAKIIADLTAAGKLPALNKVLDAVRAINAERLTVLEQEGLETPETLALWRATYGKDYIPLKGWEDSDGSTRPRTGRGFDIRGKESKAAAGRTSRASSPIANVVAQMEETLVRAEKNKVGQAFLRLVQANPDPNYWEIDTPNNIAVIDKKTGEVSYQADPRWKMHDNVLSVKVGGVEHYVTMHDPALASAMKSLGAQAQGWALRAIGTLNRFQAMMLTQVDPEFVITNITRDVQTALINMSADQQAKVLAEVTKNIPKAAGGIYSAERRNGNGEWAKAYREYREAGGKISFFGLMDIDAQKKRLERHLREAQGDLWGNTLKLSRNVVDLVSDLNTVAENATRLSVYKALTDQGYAKEVAAQYAKNITVNFNKKGEWGPVITSLYMFANAGIQGNYRMMQALTKSPRVRKVALGLVLGGVALSMLNRMLAGDDDDGENYYDKLSPELRERNLILMLPDNKGEPIKVPLPYGYNVLWVAGDNIASVAAGKKSVVKAAGDTAKALISAFNPLDSGKDLLKMALPSPAKMPYEIAVNENFMGAPIAPPAMPGQEGKPDSQRAWRKTGDTWRWLAETMNSFTGGTANKKGAVDVSPETIQHIWETYSGGLGKLALRLTNTGQHFAEGGTWADAPTKDIPFLRRFYGGQDEWYVSKKFRETTADLTATEKDYKALREVNPAAAEAYKKENLKDLVLAEKAAEAEKAVRKKTLKLNELRDAGAPKDAQDKLAQEIETVQKRFNGAVNASRASDLEEDLNAYNWREAGRDLKEDLSEAKRGPREALAPYASAKKLGDHEGMKAAKADDDFRANQRRANISAKAQARISKLEANKAKAEFRGDTARAEKLEQVIRAVRKRALERMDAVK